jgi:hypothetical protein
MQLCVEAVDDDEVAPTAPKGDGWDGSIRKQIKVRGSPLRNPPPSEQPPPFDRLHSARLRCPFIE